MFLPVLLEQHDCGLFLDNIIMTFEQLDGAFKAWKADPQDLRFGQYLITNWLTSVSDDVLYKEQDAQIAFQIAYTKYV